MTHSRKIILFNPKPNPFDYFEGAPLSLLALSRFLDIEGCYDIKIISATPEYDYVQRILETVDNSICLGITCMTGYQIHDGLRAAKAVKQEYPNIPIVWGGWHPSILPNKTVSSPFVDIVVRGQGEITFTELVHKLENNLPLDDVTGITYKKNERIIENPDRPLEDINNFPPLPYHLLDVERIIRVSENGSRTIDYISSVGCPHGCTFCADFRINKGKWSGLKAERVVNDIDSLVKRYNINAVVIHDSNFFVDEQRIVRICKGVLEKEIRIKWGQPNGRTERLLRYHEDTWKLMKQSGFDQILVGAESGSQQVLDFICKAANVNDTIRLAEICKGHGIGFVLSLMLGFPNIHGFSQSIEEEFSQTLLLIDKVRSTGVRLNICGWFPYTPYPGTVLYDLSIQSGFKEPMTFEEWSRFNLSGSNTPWMSEKYAKLLEQLGTYIFPCLGDTYIRIWKNRQATYGSSNFLSTIAILILKVLHNVSSFRWKHKVFSFMIEARLIDFYMRNARNRLYHYQRTSRERG